MAVFVSYSTTGTLQKRRADLRAQSVAAVKSLEASTQASKNSIIDSTQRMLELDQPTTILFEFVGKDLVGAREIEAKRI